MPHLGISVEEQAPRGKRMSEQLFNWEEAGVQKQWKWSVGGPRSKWRMGRCARPMPGTASVHEGQERAAGAESYPHPLSWPCQGDRVGVGGWCPWPLSRQTDKVRWIKHHGITVSDVISSYPRLCIKPSSSFNKKIEPLVSNLIILLIFGIYKKLMQ